MRMLSATTARVPPGPRSLAIVVNKCAKSISRYFMTEQDREGYVQEQGCLQCCFQVIISNSPSTGGVFLVMSAAIKIPVSSTTRIVTSR